MTKKDWFAVVALSITLSSAVFGGVAWVDAKLEKFVKRATLESYMEQVLTRLQSIEEALRR